MDYDSSDDSDDDVGNIQCKTTEEKNIYTMQLEKFQLFELQDQEKGHFDVAFNFDDGKLLYANKYVLVTASETLNSWLSDRWTKTDDPIKVETYTFDIFYQFCTFLYSGGCKLTTENIFQIVDAAEFFGIQLLKDYCDAFLQSNRDKIIKEDNIFDMAEVAEKYSLPCFTKYVIGYFWKNYEKILNDSSFKDLSKDNVLRFCVYKEKRYRSSGCIRLESAFFEALFKWTEHQAQLKKDESNDEEFNVEETIKTEFAVFLPYINFSSIDIDLLLFYYTKKLFLFSLSEWLKIVSQADGSQEETFKAVYQIAEAFALEEEKESGDENFDLYDSIKSHLSEYLRKVDFSQISFTFMTEFIGGFLLSLNLVMQEYKTTLILVERSFLFSLNDLFNGLLICRRSSSSEEKMYLTMYELAEEEVLKKQELNPVENFNVNDAIKRELAEVLPKIKFRQMDKSFLLQFVVGEGILSHDEVFGSKNVTVKIKHENGILSGVFEDNLGIADKVGKNSVPNLSYKEFKQRFTRFKFEIPTIPSELQKKDGIEWYLCLEWDGILAAKYKTLISNADYLIAELKSISYLDFRFEKGGCTYLEMTRL